MGAAESDVPPAPGAGRRRLRAVVRVVGILVAIVAVALCVRTLTSQWGSVRSAVAHADGWLLLAALGASAAAMTGLGVLWWRCLHLFGSPVRMWPAIAWYFAGELGKYLPGGIWSVLGRGELAHRGGRVNRSTGYATTLISYGAMCVAAGVVCGCLAPFFAFAGDGSVGAGWVLLLLIPVGLAAVHPRVLGPVMSLARRVTRGRLELTPPPWRAMLGLIACAVPTWALIGGAAVLVTEALGYDQQPARVAFAAVAAWIVGFLAVPVPAGAGLRELVFIGVCGLEASPATAVAAIARGLLIVVDGAGGTMGLWYARRAVAALDPDDEIPVESGAVHGEG